jgi:oxygen-independent coproporphyrinogen-3 oxidase
VDTIYFGGGTPSLYNPLVLQEIIDLISLVPRPASRVTSFTGEAEINQDVNREITLEINPDDITPTYIGWLRQTSFNRFSIGIQSFFDEDLTWLNRSHSADQAIQSVRMLQDAGYENLSIDLIYGIPSAAHEKWQKNLETAFSLDVPHISAYALTVEAKTPLAWMIGQHKSAKVNDEIQADQFKMLMEKTKEQGYLQYEISNFCKPGRHSIHNTNYWQGVPYLGLGPSAHSFNRSSRRWNISSLSKYIDGLNTGEPITEEELLTPAQKYNEYVMTSLRTMWGCDLDKIIDQLPITNRSEAELGGANYQLIRKQASLFVKQGMLTENSGVFFLTDKGKLFADRVASELFIT